MTDALSLLNFRDVGGLDTVHGKPVKKGVIYRSEGPASFLAQHRRELTDLNIKLVCDLRSATERELAPNDWAGPARLLHVELFGDLHGKRSAAMQALANSSDAEEARLILEKSYSKMPARLAPHMTKVISALASGEVPALVHCTAGKDRTGVLVGLLLELAGVDREAVVADYLRSEIYEQNLRKGTVPLPDYFEKRLGVRFHEEVAGAMARVDARLLNAALRAVDQEWGSAEAYFAVAGVDVETRAAFVRVMLGD
ncbi:MAG: tyrosine-protein phosphatase [Caulobacterales bacterium]